MSAEAGLYEFFDQVWKDTEGYVYLPVKSSSGFRKFMIPWPRKRDAVVAHVLKWAADETAEVFYSPAIYNSPKPSQENVKGSWVAWVDFDGNAPTSWPTEVAPVPTLEVQSSTSSKKHCYWELKSFTEPKALQEINRSLAYALGADLSGWDANQFLRPPFTVNRKYAKPITAKVVKNRLDLVYPEDAFDSVPKPKEAIRANISVSALPGVEEVLAGAQWDAELLKLFRTTGDEMQHEARDRSGALQRLAYEGAEKGWTDEQIMTVLLDADTRWGKYTNRTHTARKKILVDLINRARSKVGYDPKSELTGLAKALGAKIKVESPDDDKVLFSIEELASLKGIDDWRISNMLVPRGLGLITGRPGVGKTQLAFQMAADLACNRDAFLDREISEKTKVLFLSLEMNMYQLAHIAKPVFDRYPEMNQEDLSIYAKGEMLPLDQDSGQAYFEALLNSIKPGVVIIDSLSHMASAELTSDTEMKVAFEFLQRARNEFNFGLVIIHHHRKKANDAQSKKRANDLSDVYGSFYITAAVDFVLDLEERSEDADEGTLTLSYLKNRYAPIPEPVKVRRSANLHFSIESVKNMIHIGGKDEAPSLGLAI